MKKTKLSVLTLTLIGGLLLTGCKNKNDSTDPSSAEESNSGSETTEVSSSSSETPVDRHKITEQEYLKIRDYILVYIILILMSYLISTRYAVKIFKKSAMKSVREEV